MYQATTAPHQNYLDTISNRQPIARNDVYRSGRLLKLLFDYAITLPGLLFISPLFLLLALLVMLDSPGPIFHRRRVLGQDGRLFDALKFRTMHVNGDEILAMHPELRAELSRNHKLKVDPRITRVGHFLRKYSLDELPQLVNVLRRDMSLIGPRMITLPEIKLYGEHGEKLITVKPGLSGLWQVSGRSNTSYEQRVELDMAYIDNWTVWQDVKILVRTPLAVLKGEGAY